MEGQRIFDTEAKEIQWAKSSNVLEVTERESTFTGGQGALTGYCAHTENGRAGTDTLRHAPVSPRPGPCTRVSQLEFLNSCCAEEEK